MVTLQAVPAKVTVRGNRFVGNAANSVNAYNPERARALLKEDGR